MSIRNWPEGDRPREKLLQKGSSALSDAELLAIFLRTGVSGKSAVDLARELLLEFGGLRNLLSAPQSRFCQGLGLGSAKYAQLQAVLEMGRRHLEESLVRDGALSSPEITRRYLRSQLRDYGHEVFACLFLDNRNRVICFEEMFRGTINSASVHPREVVKRALDLNSAAIILVHNHPSGISEPSEADHRITSQLKDALALVEIRVLDHFIVGDDAGYSFAEAGML